MELINPKFEKNLNKGLQNKSVILLTDLTYEIPKNYDFINLPYSYEDKYKKIIIPKKCKANL